MVSVVQRAVLLSVLMTALAGLTGRGSAAGEVQGRQPVFLLLPHNGGYNAWSLCAVVDKQDPSKLAALALEKLNKVNIFTVKTYEAALAAQSDPKTPREPLGQLDAANFGNELLRVAEDKALDIGLTPLEGGSYRLMISLRVGTDWRLNFGGKEQRRRDLWLVYDRAAQRWRAVVKALENDRAEKVPSALDKVMTGLSFPVRETGIFEVDADVAGTMVRVLDRRP